ncbi:hypothetical protein J4455_03005 [Candidatus Woesearchaeota archaeon]|nr:hypothetical protein [Candidatus Woesearchaeota archaeon]
MDKEDLFKKLETIRKDIDIFRSNLNNNREEKEKLYQKRISLSDRIKDKIKKIKDLKSKKDKDNIGLQEEFKEKENLNKEISDLIIKIKKINEKIKKFRETKKIDKNPRLIKVALEKLELKIETEAISYEEEKKLMKRVNQLKKEYKSVKEIVDLDDEYNKISKYIDNKRVRLNNIKEKINEKMKTRSDYDDFMKISKEIFELKKDMKITNDGYIKLKADSLKTNLLLKEKFREFDNIKNQIGIENKKISEEKEIQKRDLIHQKVNIVEEKIKKGQKLSTDDLITFQANK